jgi:hypothetical protein
MRKKRRNIDACEKGAAGVFKEIQIHCGK